MDQVDVMVARSSGHTYTVGYCCHLGDSADPELRLHRTVIQPLAAHSRSPAGFRNGKGAAWPSLLSSGEGTVAERLARALRSLEINPSGSVWGRESRELALQFKPCGTYFHPHQRPPPKSLETV